MRPDYRRIGIIKPCCIGDAVMSLPVIDNLLQNYPEADIEVWCGEHSRSVYECHPGVQRIIDIPSIPKPSDLPTLIRLLRTSDNDGFLILDRSRLIDAACRVTRVNVLGTVRSQQPNQDHETDGYLGTVVRAGMSLSSREPSIHFDASTAKALVERFGLQDTPFVVLHPGGAENPGATMHSKRWPEDRWKQLIGWLATRSVRAVLTGSGDETELCRGIAEGSGTTIAAGKLTLIESATLASAANAYVGPDTGLSHLVAATGTPVVAIFGPTNPRQYAPRGREVTILAAPGSYQVSSADLRNSDYSGLPSTDEVSTEAVTSALTGYLANREAVD